MRYATARSIRLVPAVLGVLWITIGPAAPPTAHAQTAAGAPQTAGAPRTPDGPRTADGRPNLNGIWQALNSANWDIEAHEARPGPPQLGALLAAPAGLGVVVGGRIPYQPWAAAKKKENFNNRWSEDPEAKCYLPGVPRAMYMPFPFQIVQGTDTIMMIFEYASTVRTINLGKVPAAPIETWMGHSVGRWDGQSLVVDVTALNGMAWFDRAGNFQSENLHVVERYTPMGADAINYEATIEDPKMYTRSWTIRMPLYRRLEKDIQLLEYRCVPFSEELLYGDLRKKPAR